jgi:diaminohydroxyphosphoribosylaminopyrimidine deaminase/5-amino-6-(5-phosphoribosylamino)uracil reductase
MYRLDDLDFMREALRLAEEGTGLASPNPRVGAVVVREGRIVGRGTHLYEGKTHAEALALEEAGERAQGATLYLNLEPCCHTGRTPPCTQAIVRAGIARVVAAMSDPNPRVAGNGLRELEAAGITVETGCLEREARRLNEAFSKWIRTGLPFVTLKAAVSLDGRIAAAAAAPGERTWISSLPARERVQQLRHQADALLTGIGTVLRDDPLLTDRSKRLRRRRLLRVVLDRELRLPPSARLVASARKHKDLLVFHASDDAAKWAALEHAGARLEAIEPAAEEGLALERVLRRLGEMDITSVLLEAGARLNGAMLAGGFVDKVILFVAPKLLGEHGLPLGTGNGAFARLPEGGLTCETVGPDVMIEVYLAE